MECISNAVLRTCTPAIGLALLLLLLLLFAAYRIHVENTVFAQLPPRWGGLPIFGTMKDLPGMGCFTARWFMTSYDGRLGERGECAPAPDAVPEENDSKLLYEQLLQGSRELDCPLISYKKYGTYVVGIHDYANMRELLIEHGCYTSGRISLPGFSMLAKRYGINSRFVFSDGQQLRIVRRKLMTLMHKFAYANPEYAANVQGETLDMCTTLVQGHMLNPEEHIFSLITKMLFRICFNKEIDHRARRDHRLFFEEIKYDIDKVFEMGFDVPREMIYPYEWMLHIPFLGARKHYKSYLQAVNDFFTKTWGEFKDKEDDVSAAVGSQGAGQQSDILGEFLCGFNKGGDGHGLIKAELYGKFFDLIIAGVDTTATTLQWLTFLMAERPDIQEKVVHEIDGYGKELISLSDLEYLPYTNAVIHEAQRFGAVVPMAIPHRVVAPFTSKSGHFYPEDTTLLINIWAILRDPKVWQYPDEFWPGHFLNSTGVKFVPRAEFVPYGIGARGCVGQHMARIELVVIFTTMVRTILIAKPPGAQWNPKKGAGSSTRKPIFDRIHFSLRE